MSSKDSAIFKLQIAVGTMLEQKPPEGAASKWLAISDLRLNTPEATAVGCHRSETLRSSRLGNARILVGALGFDRRQVCDPLPCMES